MKNRKLNLNSIKVKSFVTDMETENSETINGGGTPGVSSTWNIYTLMQFGCGIYNASRGGITCNVQ